MLSFFVSFFSLFIFAFFFFVLLFHIQYQNIMAFITTVCHRSILLGLRYKLGPMNAAERESIIGAHDQ